MKTKKLSILFWGMLTLFALQACQPQETMETLTVDNIAVRWELLENYNNQQTQYRAVFTLTNEGSIALPDEGWALYFNRLPRNFTLEPGSPLQMEHINGDFYRILPVKGQGGIAPGDSAQLFFAGGYWAIKESDAPCGLYFVVEGDGDAPQKITEVSDFEIVPFSRPEQYNRGPNDQFPYPDAAYLYQANAAVPIAENAANAPFLPFPNSYQPTGNTANLDNSWIIAHAPEAEREAQYLAAQLNTQLGLKLEMQPITKNATKRIMLQVVPNSVAGKTGEAYQLSVRENTIAISGNGPSGVFYGIQSLLGMVPPSAYAAATNPVVNMPTAQITDAPAFRYRGLHLDVSRNFHPKTSVLKLLDLMARYKLNKFHFHLTDDEGWRLEIPGLPELTSYGAMRAHTLDEAEHLHPAYGSGPDTDSQGSGFYTKADYIEILRYAAERHIEIIPEIDMPGHARAAIKAMEYRYQKLMEEGKPEEAAKFRLKNPADESEYRSVQNYTDNVVAVCQESTYNFLAKVTEEIVAMHREAEAPLTAIHTGGDEVPGGAWEKSPECQALIAENAAYNRTSDLSTYFLSRFQEIIAQHGLQTAGWEEIALKKEGEGHGSYVVNPNLVDKNLLPYVWNTVWGSGMEDLSYRLANVGYPVVMCNATNLYFDFAYSKHPEEPGYYWGGLVDTKTAYRTVPFDVFLSAEIDLYGNPIDPEKMRQQAEKLTEKGKANILGIQGQLWSETVKSPDMMEYYTTPKLLGLAQRAWEGQPAWASIADAAQREAAIQQDWGKVAQVIGQQEMPKLDNLFDGVHYRLPPPGATIEEGMLKANTAYPGLTIRYTTDGSTPNADSPEYTGLVAVDGPVQLRVFNTLGRGSRVVSVK